MEDRTKTSNGGTAETESYLGILGNLVGLLGAVLVLLVIVRTGSKPAAPTRVVSPVAVVTAIAPPAPEPKPVPVPEVAAPKPLDRVAVARAEEQIDAVSRDRARAQARAEDAAKRLAEATAQAALEASRNRKLALRVRDPSAQLASVTARGGFLRAERDRLKTELGNVAQAPRPKAKSLVEKNPVAKPAGGNEYHFEVRRDRVAFIDLDRLMELVKADAQLRIRLSESSRVVDSKVGPIGAFSLEYVLGRAMPNGIEELMERHGLNFDLRGWEIVPEHEGRGETYERTRQPISQYALTINRLSPSRATITMWVYPDGFALYRKLRDDLHERGYTVAARPLPEGMAIRGSPAGSISAGQ
ncbi:hypothetical protein [Singulisphaera acidiphila]|uniref:Uncharacterized protein n=1 Tax=Singulisphaera acidiphila (strain ATCC BAA-1392 / DSM 18658 / VKM B-2454 / MOB10) TaxID=886293 RepID=L0DM45_SINAD|nr:hypothetical protein [Singulisphaera acidiphila]AGA30332.1 hypothetical protein Sinac_6234 [Singulisphaera acidiphila DSM 18658]